MASTGLYHAAGDRDYGCLLNVSCFRRALAFIPKPNPIHRKAATLHNAAPQGLRKLMKKLTPTRSTIPILANNSAIQRGISFPPLIKT